MSRYRVVEDFDRPSFELSYYDELGRNEEVTEAIRLRNDGWDLFRSGFVDDGIDEILESRDLLMSSVGGPFELYGDISAPDKLRQIFVRESYASMARLAQVLCAVGEYEDAVNNARLALAHLPYSFVQTVTLWPLYDGQGGSIGMNAQADPYDRGPSRVNIELFDQYRAIFEGRLAAVLATSTEAGVSKEAIGVARYARQFAIGSEDPARFMFVNSDMTQAQRNETARRFTRVARAATVAAHSPLPVARLVAQKVCGK